MSNKFRIIVSLLFVTLVVMFFGLFLVSESSSDNTPNNVTSPSTEPASENVNPSPDTDKASVIEKNDQIDNSTDMNAVKPVIVYAGIVNDNLEIGSYVPVVDSGGSCTATITNATTTISFENDANTGATTTDCEVFSIPVNQLNSGNSMIVISYSSMNYEGESEPESVVIP